MSFLMPIFFFTRQRENFRWRLNAPLSPFTAVSRCDFCTHLGREHVANPVEGALEQESPHQEADQHHVGEQGAEVHHLQARRKRAEDFLLKRPDGLHVHSQLHQTQNFLGVKLIRGSRHKRGRVFPAPAEFYLQVHLEETPHRSSFFPSHCCIASCWARPSVSAVLLKLRSDHQQCWRVIYY